MNWTHPSIEAIACLVSRRTGLNFPPSQRDRVEQGIRLALQRARGGTLEQYQKRIQSDPSALDDLVSELTVGETYFFREPEQFEFLRREIVPEWRQRDLTHPLRVWSAGCASGEEAYSLAMLLDREGLAGRAHLLASDINQAALARARQASYGPWSLRGPAGALARPYLIQEGDRFVVEERIRRRVSFEYRNLVQDQYPSLVTGVWSMDLILCRNVLIYFDPQTVTKVAARLFESLAPGGWLFTASSDPPLQGLARFELVVRDAGVFYRGPRAKTVGWAERSEAHRSATTAPVAPVGRAALGPLDTDPTPVQRVRFMADHGAAAAERVCAAEAARDPLVAELHYLHAILLIGLGWDDAALQALRRVLYLDRSLAVAHFTLGSLLHRRGDLSGARRAYLTARDLCRARPTDEQVPLSDGESAGRLAEAAAFQLQLLESLSEAN